MATKLMQGADAVAEAAINVGCRFFAGYPMSPFTGLLESMSRRMPEVGGFCVNAESEIEGVNMALGASAGDGCLRGNHHCIRQCARYQSHIDEGARPHQAVGIRKLRFHPYRAALLIHRFGPDHAYRALVHAKFELMRAMRI